jgi:hypothetical protein
MKRGMAVSSEACLLLDEHNIIAIVSRDIAATVAIADTLWIMGRNRGTPTERSFREPASSM